MIVVDVGITVRKARHVIVYIVAMVVVLAIAAAVAGVVMVGIEGRGHARMPRIAAKLTQTAKHLNGEGTPPPDTGSTQQSRQHREQTPAGHI